MGQEHIKQLIQVNRSELKESIFILLAENADYNPVEGCFNGWFVEIETLQNLCLKDFYDEEDIPNEEDINILQRMCKDITDTLANFIYVRND